MNNNTLFFEYPHEPPRSGLILAAGAAVMTALILLFVRPPFAAGVLAVTAFSVAVGGVLWALLQRLRQGCGVTLHSDRLEVKHLITRRVRAYPLKDMRGAAARDGESVVVFYLQARQPPSSRPVVEQPALTTIRPTPTGPHRRLLITPPIQHADQLAALLCERLSAQGQTELATTDYLLGWATRKIWRNRLLKGLVLLGVPIYVIILFRIIASLLAVGGQNLGR